MRLLQMVVFGLGLVLVGGTADTFAADPPNKEKLIGTWVVTKSETLPPGVTAVVEFTKDGKIKLSATFKDKESKQEGTYEVDGDKINTVIRDKKETSKIKKLTDKELVVEDDKGKIDEYKKK